LEVGRSGYGWKEFFTLSQLRKSGSRCLSTDGTLKLSIRFVQFGGIVECKKGKDEELKGLKERAGETILLTVGVLLDFQAMSDLKIRTSDGKVFQAYKLILAGSRIVFIVLYLL
jgi:hypothetical protein